MKKIKQKQSKKPIIAIIIILVVLIAGGGVAYALVSNQQDSKPTETTSTSESTLKENNTNNSEPSSEQIDAANQTKEESVNRQPDTTNVSVSIMAYKKDGYTVKVDSTINAALNSGKCELTISNSDVTKTYSADIQQLANYSTCKGFDIPVSDLSSGRWIIKLNVNSQNYKGTASSNIDT